MGFQDNPTLNEIIRNEIDRVLLNANTAMPAEIVEYNPSLQEAVVKPCFKRKLVTEAQARDLPLISGVRVCFPKMGKAHIRIPIEAGQEGLLIFSQRSLDKWQKNGGCVDPQDPRKFHLSDATFWMGLTSDKNVIKSKGAPSSLEIANDEAFIEIKKNGEFLIKNKKAEVVFSSSGKFQFKGEQNELMATLVELLDKLISAQVITAIGPQQFLPSTIADFTAVKTKLEGLKK